MMRHTLFSACLAAVFGLLLACGGGKSLTKTSGDSGRASLSGMREDFNPAELDDDDIKIEESGESGTNIDDILGGSSAAPADTIGNGYRIQIIQTTDPEEARAVQKDAIVRFEYDVYRVFDPPYYKVRVGNFVTWDDAEQVQKLAIRKGFRDAWVIRTKINLKKAYRAANEW